MMIYCFKTSVEEMLTNAFLCLSCVPVTVHIWYFTAAKISDTICKCHLTQICHRWHTLSYYNVQVEVSTSEFKL